MISRLMRIFTVAIIFLFLIHYATIGYCVSSVNLRISESDLETCRKSIDDRLSGIKKFKAPCRIKIISPDDMSGRKESMLGTKVYHYPLKNILDDLYNSAIYHLFLQPGGKVVDSFTIEVEVFESTLMFSGSKADYHLYLHIKFKEPGEKIILTKRIEKRQAGNFSSSDNVPSVIYETIKESAISLIDELQSDQKVLASVSKYSVDTQKETGVKYALGEKDSMGFLKIFESTSDKRVAIMPTKDSEGKDILSIADRLNVLFSESKRFTIAERQRLKDAIDEINVQGTDYFDNSKIVKVGQMAGADFMLISNVTDRGNFDFSVTLKLIEVKSGIQKTVAEAESTDGTLLNKSLIEAVNKINISF